MTTKVMIQKTNLNFLSKFLKKGSFLANLIKFRVLFLMLLPALLYAVVIDYLPLSGLMLAFKKYNYADGIFGSPWAGFNNFRYMIESGKLTRLIFNTVAYNVIFIVLGQILKITIAILLAEMVGKKIKKLIQSLMFLPYFVSWVVAAAFAYNFLNYEYGIVNSVIKSFGGQPVDVYATPWVWYFILPIFNAWKWVGYGSVLYLATIMGMDAECFESAEIDGANAFQRIWHITIPLLKPTITILILLSIGRILRGDFQMFYQLVGNASLLYDTTDVIDTFVFRSLTQVSDMGMTAAASLLQSVFCFILIVTVNALVKKYQSDSALF